MMIKKTSIRKNRNNLILCLCTVSLVLIIVCIMLFVLKDDNKDESSIEQNKATIVEQSDETKVEKSKVTIIEQSNEIVQDEVAFYEIETKYCNLYFPETWKKQIEVKYTEESGYKAEFYGLVEGKNAQHLFDVFFNSDDGDLLGYLDGQDEVVNISIDVMELEFDDSWKQEEIDQIYSMQEEMNFVIDALSKNDNYVEP